LWLYQRIQHKKQTLDFLVEFLEIFSEITTNAQTVGTTYKRPVIAVEMQLIPTAANFLTIWLMGVVLILDTILEGLTATNLDHVPAIIMVSLILFVLRKPICAVPKLLLKIGTAKWHLLELG
jgi:hypothetical protein